MASAYVARTHGLIRGGTPAGTVEPCPSPTPADDQREDATGRRARPKYRAWADLMRRALTGPPWALYAPRRAGGAGERQTERPTSDVTSPMKTGCQVVCRSA